MVIAADTDERHAVLRDLLERHAPEPDADYLRLRDLVDRMRDDASLVRVGAAARAGGLEPRTLQRHFRARVGVSAKWVLARFRLQEAAVELERDPGGEPRRAVGPARLARPGALHERLPPDDRDHPRPVRGGRSSLTAETVGGGWQHPAGREWNTVDVIGPAAARRAALAAQGFADARPPGPPTRRHLARLLSRIRLLQLDSVNVAVRAHYMPVFSRLGPVRPGAGGRRRLDTLGAPAPDAGGVLGARGQPAAGRRLAAAAVGRQARGLVAALRGARRPGAGAGRRAAGRGQGAGPGGCRDAGDGAGSGHGAAEGRHVVGALGHQADLRVPVRHRRAHHRGAGALPAALRPARAGPAPRGPRGAPGGPRGVGAGAGAARGRRPRRRDGAGPARLLPPRAGAVAAGRRRAARGRRAGAGRRPRLAPSGVPAARHADPAARHGPGAALAVRPADLGARPHRADLRVPLPHRDLRARAASASTATTSSRSCSTTPWSPGSTSRRTGRRACSACRAPSPRRRSTSRGSSPSWPPPCARWRRGRGSTAWSSATAATSPPRSPEALR